jgi:antitoxin VapB
MALEITDPEIEEVVKQLAAEMGEPEAASVRIAVQEKLDRIRKDKPREIDWGAVRAIQERVAKSPVLDDRSSDELLGYNKFGQLD